MSRHALFLSLAVCTGAFAAPQLPRHADLDLHTARQLADASLAPCSAALTVLDRGGNLPNLGYLDKTYIEHLDKFIFKGPAMARGMPDFTGKLSMDDVEKIKAFIQGPADAVRPK